MTDPDPTEGHSLLPIGTPEQVRQWRESVERYRISSCGRLDVSTTMPDELTEERDAAWFQDGDGKLHPIQTNPCCEMPPGSKTVTASPTPSKRAMPVRRRLFQ